MSGSSEARKRGHDDDLEPGSEVLEHGKRRRVNGSSLCSSTPSSPSPAQTDKLPDLAVLYHAAISAHNSAHYHLQQAFVPAYIEVPQDEVLECTTPAGRAPFTHDPHAMSAALRCLVMALDLLHAGLHTPRISDKEYAAFGLEFTVVALKLLGAMDALKTLSEADRARVGIVVDVERLGRELEDSLPKFLVVAQRSPHLKKYRFGLELASARLAFMNDKTALGKKIVKQAYQKAPSSECLHRYNLSLLLLNHLIELNSPDVFSLIDDLEKEARTQGHKEVVQIAHLARLSGMIRQRRWDSLLKAFEESAQVLDSPSDSAATSNPPSHSDQVFLFHFLILRALVQGRAGQDDEARQNLKRLYRLMDSASGTKAMKRLREDGGLLRLRLSSPQEAAEQELLVQSTPVNVLYSSAYLATVVARRDVQGTVKNCRTLSYARALRASEMLATAGDIWDCGFSPEHGLADVISTRSTLHSLLVEVMMEEAFALICRNAFQEADELLTTIAGRLRQYRLYHTHGVQLTLLYGQFVHTLGLSEQAARYYEAAQVMLAPGSELRLIVDIGLLAVQGRLEGLHQDADRALEVKILADQCRSGSNRALHGVGLFLGSLADPERVSSKRQLSHAYEISRKGNPLLHCLIFAFTTGTHVYGDRERMLKLLDAGATLAQMLGGKDREDGVGQAVLGLWFAIKLRDYHRLSSQFEDMAKAEVVVERHKKRLAEIKTYAAKRFR